MLDNIKENSAKQHRKNREARLLSMKQLEEYKDKREQYVKKQLALWRSTGLPPNKWK